MKERRRREVPFYDARIEDLKPGDFVVVECGNCGHTTAIPPSRLLRGLGLRPTQRVLDLELRFPCRLCYM